MIDGLLVLTVGHGDLPGGQIRCNGQYFRDLIDLPCFERRQLRQVKELFEPSSIEY